MSKMDEEDFLFSERNEFNFESKLIRNDSKNIYNRLRSIAEDSEFVMRMTELLPDLALIANERCGSWYIDRTKKKPYSGYFKSTDGHMHIWDFNIRRNNLHLIPTIVQHNGCLIIDSTRKGKRLPDALSKTIPIWCATLNRALARLHPLPSWDLTLHTLPSAVSRSEHAQIESRLDGFVDRLLSSGVRLEGLELKKPLRPIWYTPDCWQALEVAPPDFSDADFYPIVCVSASDVNQDKMGYVQGAADDQEAWAMGLTHHLFWKYKDEILNDPAECEKRVKEVVSTGMVEDEDEKCYGFVTDCLAIGKIKVECWKEFDYVIYAAEEDLAEGSNYLRLPIPEGKKGQIVFGSSLKQAIEFVRLPILEGNKKILVCCSSGKDHSVGLLLAILIHYFDLDGKLYSGEKPRVDKKRVQHQLVQIISHWEKASPSRVTLKRVNTHFMSHSS